MGDRRRLDDGDEDKSATEAIRLEQVASCDFNHHSIGSFFCMTDNLATYCLVDIETAWAKFPRSLHRRNVSLRAIRRPGIVGGAS